MLREASAAYQNISGRLQAQESQQQAQSGQLQGLTTVLQRLTEQLAALGIPAPAPVSPAPHAVPLQPPAPVSQPYWDPYLDSTKPYDRTFAECSEFLMQCNYVFTHQPSMYSSDMARVGFIDNLTTGDALRWVQANPCSRFRDDYAAFEAEFRSARTITLNSPPSRRATAPSLPMPMSSGTSRMAVGRMTSVYTAFRWGLSETLKDKLIRHKTTSLAQLVSHAIENERVRGVVPLSCFRRSSDP